MSARRVRLGISPCPNDTFVFHGLLSGAIRVPGVDLAIELHDVEALNQKFAARELDVSKASFFAALSLARDCVVLSAGSAVGFGVGPLLLARAGAPPLANARVLCPGERTTAHFLYRAFHPREGRVEQALFSDIMPSLERGDADYGVCIHEGRFTYREHGLVCVEDLGETWERATRSPLPLGGILASRGIGVDVARTLDRAIRDSLIFARGHPREAFATMQEHAQELDERVIWQHVDLYVNEWTRELGAVGRAALAELSSRARAAGLSPSDAPDLEVLDSNA